MIGRKWMPLSACFAFGAPLLVGLVHSFMSTTGPGGALVLLVGVLALFGYLTIGLISLGVGVAQALKGRWMAFLPCSIVPSAMAMFVVFPGTLGSIANAADYIHFAIFSARYERAVNAVPRTDKPRLVWFFWVDASVPLNGETLVFLAFDESDEFAFPDVQRSASWKICALNSFKEATGFAEGPNTFDELHHLFGHYYVVAVNSW